MNTYIRIKRISDYLKCLFCTYISYIIYDYDFRLLALRAISSPGIRRSIHAQECTRFDYYFSFVMLVVF